MSRIPCQNTPNVPKGRRVVQHKNLGLFDWNPGEIEFLPLDPCPSVLKDACLEDIFETFTGAYRPNSVWRDTQQLLHNLHVRVSERGGDVLTADVLDYLLEHQQEVPPSWEGKHIIFAGTLYEGKVTGPPAQTSHCIAREMIMNPYHGLHNYMQSGLQPWWSYLGYPISALVLRLECGTAHFVENNGFAFDTRMRYLTDYYVPISRQQL